MLKLLFLLVVLAPVPAPPRPDPLGMGFLGVAPAGDSLTLTVVRPGSPADRGGLQVGDELVRVGRLAPTRFDEAREFILNTRPGTRLEVVVKRAGKPVTLRVVVGLKVFEPNERDPFDPNRILPNR